MEVIKDIGQLEVPGGVVKVALLEGRGGGIFVDLRKFYEDKEGVVRPTQKGVCIARDRARELWAILADAIEDDDEDIQDEPKRERRRRYEPVGAKDET